MPINPPPLSGDANLDRWINLLLKQVNSPTLGNYANDAAAAAAGVSIGSLYRNGSIVMVRVA